MTYKFNSDGLIISTKNESKEIEEIELYTNFQDCYNNEDKLDCNFEEIENKINELIKAVNELKKGK